MTGIISFFFDCMHYITKKVKKKGQVFLWLINGKKTIFSLKKIIISCVSYWTLHVKQPDVASGVRPETKPLVILLIKMSPKNIVVPNRQSHSMRLYIKQGGCLSRPRYAKKKCLVKFYEEN